MRNNIFRNFLKILFSVVRSRSVQNGGGEGNRTHDPLRAKQVLSQLSYTPILFGTNVVGLDRFELSTSRLSGVRSNQLSYRPIGAQGYFT